MKKLTWLALLCIPMAAQAGDIYRWVNPAGTTQYSDAPPPTGVQQAGRLAGSQAPAAQEKPAVVLYTGACGPLCDDAKAWLADNSIPYTTKDAQREVESATELKKLVGSLEIPTIKVGEKSSKGFNPIAWGQLLNGAGYVVTKVTSTPAEKK